MYPFLSLSISCAVCDTTVTATSKKSINIRSRGLQCGLCNKDFDNPMIKNITLLTIGLIQRPKSLLQRQKLYYKRGFGFKCN